jgi:acyl dehydratase
MFPAAQRLSSSPNLYANRRAVYGLPMRTNLSKDTLLGIVGAKAGRSGWLPVDQAIIDAFAEATGDRQFIHVDPQRAAKTPFGGTVAHGFLTLSLLSKLAEEALPDVAGREISVNYGFEKVRFIAPVLSGARIRAHFVLLDCVERAPKEIIGRYAVTVEIEGGNRPALAAEWLILSILS